MLRYMFVARRNEGSGATDHQIMRFVTAHRTPGMTRFATDVMNAGGNRAAIGMCAIAALILVVGFRAVRVAVAGTTALVAATLLSPALKDVVERPGRPGPSPSWSRVVTRCRPGTRCGQRRSAWPSSSSCTPAHPSGAR